MQQELIKLINVTLDRVRADEHITSDEALAKRLGVSDVAIYRWRNGQISKSSKILLPLVAKPQFVHPVEAAS